GRPGRRAAEHERGREGRDRGRRRAATERRVRSDACRAASRARCGAADAGPPAGGRGARAAPRPARRRRARDTDDRRAGRAGTVGRSDRARGAQAGPGRRRHRPRRGRGAAGDAHAPPRPLLARRATAEVERRRARRARGPRRRSVPVTRAAGVVLTLVGLLLGFARPGAAACEACVTAGAGRAVLALPPGTPLGGYGSLDRRLLFPDVFGRYPHAFWLKPSRGQREPLAARALTLERDGTRVTWVTLDLVAVDQELTRLLTARLGPDV